MTQNTDPAKSKPGKDDKLSPDPVRGRDTNKPQQQMNENKGPQQGTTDKR